MAFLLVEIARARRDVAQDRFLRVLRRVAHESREYEPLQRPLYLTARRREYFAPDELRAEYRRARETILVRPET